MEKENKQKGVLILSPFFLPNTGGVETHLSDLVSYLSKNGWNVSVITYKPLTTRVSATFKEKQGDNVLIYRIPWFGKTLFHKFEKYPLLQFFYLTPGLLLFAFFFLLKNKKKYKIIHAHGFAASFVANILSRFFKVRLVSSMHAIYGFGGGYLTTVCRWILSRFDKVFCLAEPSRQDLLKAGLPSSLLDIYVQWVDKDNFKIVDKNSARIKLGLPDKFTVLFLGRLIEKKGAKVLLEVAKSLDKINFVFVGDGPLENEFLKEGGVYKNVLIVGRKSPKEAADYYGSCDVFVLPSQYEEGFARVVIETLYSGRPIISANKGCLPYMINNSVGFLVDPTAENIKEKILYLYNNRAEIERLTGNCRNYAMKKFGEENAQHIIDSYLPRE